MTYRPLLGSVLILAVGHCGGQVSTATSTKNPARDASPTPDSATGRSDAPAPQGDAGSPCARDSDCSGGTRCAFSAAAACGWDARRCTTGTCKTPLPPSPCGAIMSVTACGCDGAAVTWDGGCAAVFPAGFAPVPYSHLGPCEGGSACASPADCGPDETCAYAAGAGCAAKGQCVPSGECACDNVCCSSTSAGACDGSGTEVDCRGYAPKPVCTSNCE